MFVDIHTHNQVFDNQNIIKIINLDNNELIRDEVHFASDFYSAGIHPWDVNSCNDDILKRIAEICEKENVVSIGESGLDRVHKETFEKQQIVFHEMIKISENTCKPLIIHAVRSYSDVIYFRKKTNAKMPWIIHGFQGSRESAEQLIRNSMYISLGEILFRVENQAVSLIKSIPPNRLFLETDVSGRDIREVYQKAADTFGWNIDYLEKMIFSNFSKVFSDGKLEEQDTNISW